MRRLPFVLILVLVVGLAACGGDGSSSATTAAPKRDPRCIEGTTTITNAIASGLKVKPKKLVAVEAVKSTAFGSVFFISGRIAGAPSKPIGTWATNNLNLGGLMFSVDPVAKKLSKWPDGSTFEAKLTMKLDGARLSRTCVKQAGG